MQVLSKSLEDQDPANRALALHALGEMGPNARSAIPKIREALKDPDDEVRRKAAEALEKIEL